jgi:hypothetical protein
MKKNKIYVLGDSFCHDGHLHLDKFYFWVKMLSDFFKEDYEIINDSYPSRDVQTIIDNWIKLIKHIKEDDILIICIPFFTRIRVPLDEKDFMIKNYNDFEIIHRFVTHHSWYYTENQKIYMNDTVLEKKELDSIISPLERIYFNSKAVEQNYNEVIKSLYDITNCRKYIFSWDDMNNTIDEIEYKSDLTKKIGWTILSDLYKKTNGKYGIDGDFHWDYVTHENFGNYLINKFKK